jgi:hypothetical protein
MRDLRGAALEGKRLGASQIAFLSRRMDSYFTIVYTVYLQAET